MKILLGRVKVDHVLIGAAQRKQPVSIKTTPSANREAMEALKSIVLKYTSITSSFTRYSVLLPVRISLFLALLIAKFMGRQYMHISKNDYFGRQHISFYSIQIAYIYIYMCLTAESL